MKIDIFVSRAGSSERSNKMKLFYFSWSRRNKGSTDKQSGIFLVA